MEQGVSFRMTTEFLSNYVFSWAQSERAWRRRAAVTHAQSQLEADRFVLSE